MPTTYELKADFVSLAQQYAGRWVGLHPESQDVVSSGDTAREALEAARRVGVEDPIITRVVADYGTYVSCVRV